VSATQTRHTSRRPLSAGVRMTGVKVEAGAARFTARRSPDYRAYREEETRTMTRRTTNEVPLCDGLGESSEEEEDEEVEDEEDEAEEAEEEEGAEDEEGAADMNLDHELLLERAQADGAAASALAASPAPAAVGVDEQGRSPLWHAASSGDEVAVAGLLAAGAQAGLDVGDNAG